jgi:hypothetical protein
MLDLVPASAHLKRLCVSLDRPADTLLFQLGCGNVEVAEWRVKEREIGLSQPLQDVPSLSSRSFPGSDRFASWTRRLLSGIVTEFNLDRVIDLVSPKLSLPESILRSMRSALSPRDGETPLLWLNIGRPAGYLHLLPWERMLRSPLGVRLLRLPYRNVKPKVASSAPQIALCCSALARRDALKPTALEEIVTGIAGVLPTEARIHLFVDELYRADLDRLALKPAAAALGSRLVLHPAPGWLPEAADRGDEKANHPWMSWIQEELAGQGVDLVHFVASAHWSAGSHLEIARIPMRLGEPDDKSVPIRYLSAQDIHSFLNQLGAWSCIFTSPGQSASLLGMRELMDQLAQLRPGAIVLHDVAADSGCQALVGSYRFLYGGAEALPPESDAVSLLCHPWQAGFGRDKLGEVNLGIVGEAIEALHRLAEAPGETPRWVTSCQRYLETEMSKLSAGTPRSALEQGVEKGAREALRLFAEGLLQLSQRATPGLISGEDDG